MVKSNQSKWMIGFTGAALSAFVIAQVGGANNQNQGTVSSEKHSTASMSNDEKRLVQLDWSNYSINGASVVEPFSDVRGITNSDRQTRRS